MSKPAMPFQQPHAYSSLHMVVQKVLKEHLSQNDHLSLGLYEKIAQSLVAIKTRLLLLEREMFSESPKFTEAIREINLLVQSSLSEIRSIEDDWNSSSFSNLGLEAILRELCLKTSIVHDFPIFFEGKGDSRNWVDRYQAVCLNYYVNLALEFISKEKWLTFISLQVEKDRALVVCQSYWDSSELNFEQLIQDELLPILQEWMELWNGELEINYPGDGSFHLTACLNRKIN